MQELHLADVATNVMRLLLSAQPYYGQSETQRRRYHLTPDFVELVFCLIHHVMSLLRAVHSALR